jgi:hypothetical protein
MGEAKFTHQTFLWHVRERGEDANLDRRLRLCAGGYHQNQLALNVSLYTFLQILSVHSFEKVPLAQALFDGQPVSPFSAPSNQMNLFAN